MILLLRRAFGRRRERSAHLLEREEVGSHGLVPQPKIAHPTRRPSFVTLCFVRSRPTTPFHSLEESIVPSKKSMQINNLLGNVGNLVLKIDAVGNRAVPQIDGLQQRSDRICPSATSSSPTNITERVHEANHRHLVALSLLLQGLDVRHELVQTVRLQKVPKQRLYWSFRPPPPTVHESARNKVHHNIHIRLDFRRVQYREQFCHEPIADLLHLVLVYRLRVPLTPT